MMEITSRGCILFFKKMKISFLRMEIILHRWKFTKISNFPREPLGHSLPSLPWPSLLKKNIMIILRLRSKSHELLGHRQQLSFSLRHLHPHLQMTPPLHQKALGWPLSCTENNIQDIFTKPNTICFQLLKEGGPTVQGF